MLAFDELLLSLVDVGEGVSPCDAASLVMGMLSSRGNLAPVTALWGVSTGAAAAVLQQAAIIAAAPFTLVMIGLCISLFKGLGREAAPRILPEGTPAQTERAAGATVAAPRSPAGGH